MYLYKIIGALFTLIELFVICYNDEIYLIHFLNIYPLILCIVPQNLTLFSSLDELLSSNRRIQIVNEGRQLRVVLLQSSDRGTYKCRGENSAGSVEGSARLAVTQTGKRGKIVQGYLRLFLHKCFK